MILNDLKKLKKKKKRQNKLKEGNNKDNVEIEIKARKMGEN